MTTITEWYARANATWPDPLPKPTPEQAVLAVKRLWKWGMNERMTYPVELTSGRNYTWRRNGKMYVNPDSDHHGGGWKALIHDLSHLMWRRANREEGVRPHEKGHAKLELRMVKEVIKRGWLNETPREEAPIATKKDVQSTRYAGINRRIESWEAKERRAKNAIKKLRRQAAYYERQLGA